MIFSLITIFVFTVVSCCPGDMMLSLFGGSYWNPCVVFCGFFFCHILLLSLGFPPLLLAQFFPTWIFYVTFIVFFSRTPILPKFPSQCFSLLPIHVALLTFCFPLLGIISGLTSVSSPDIFSSSLGPTPLFWYIFTSAFIPSNHVPCHSVLF